MPEQHNNSQKTEVPKTADIAAGHMNISSVARSVDKTIGDFSRSYEGQQALQEATAMIVSGTMIPVSKNNGFSAAEEGRLDTLRDRVEDAVAIALRAVREGGSEVFSSQSVTSGCAEERAACIRAAGAIAATIIQFDDFKLMNLEIKKAFEDNYRELRKRFGNSGVAESHWAAIAAAGHMTAGELALTHIERAGNLQAPQGDFRISSQQEILLSRYREALATSIRVTELGIRDTSEESFIVAQHRFEQPGVQMALILEELSPSLQAIAAQRVLSGADSSLAEALALSVGRCEVLRHHIDELKTHRRFTSDLERDGEELSRLKADLLAVRDLISSADIPTSLAVDYSCSLLDRLEALRKQDRLSGFPMDTSSFRNR